MSDPRELDALDAWHQAATGTHASGATPIVVTTYQGKHRAPYPPSHDVIRARLPYRLITKEGRNQ